mgnify:CR=1 FL=1
MIKINSEKCIGCGLCAFDCQCSNIKIVSGKATSKNNNCLSCGHCIAVCPQNAVILDEYDMDEISEYNASQFYIEPEKLLNSIKFRRSVRHFKNIPVEREKIKTIIEAGRFTPTGGNSQPLSYIVVEQNMKELTGVTIDTLYKMALSYKKTENDNASSERYTLMWKLMHREYKKGNDTLFFNAPAMIIILCDKKKSSNPYVDGALAASNMEAMANSFKLGACFNGFFTFASSDESIRNYLEIHDDRIVVTSLLVGYTDNKYLRTVPRKKAEIAWK